MLYLFNSIFYIYFIKINILLFTIAFSPENAASLYFISYLLSKIIFINLKAP